MISGRQRAFLCNFSYILFLSVSHFICISSRCEHGHAYSKTGYNHQKAQWCKHQERVYICLSNNSKNDRSLFRRFCKSNLYKIKPSSLDGELTIPTTIMRLAFCRLSINHMKSQYEPSYYLFLLLLGYLPTPLRFYQKTII